jgi:hypothetical protein
MKKYLFLDIDGVLAVPDEKVKEWVLNKERQIILGKILTETGAEIVLSSSWRENTLEGTRKYMTSEGFLFSDLIVGITIRAYHYIDRSHKIHLSIPRGVEIQQWIDTNVHSDQGKNFDRKTVGVDYTYCILDDDRDMLLHQGKYFVNTDSTEGLTEENAQWCIDILNGNYLP